MTQQDPKLTALLDAVDWWEKQPSQFHLEKLREAREAFRPKLELVPVLPEKRPEWFYQFMDEYHVNITLALPRLSHVLDESWSKLVTLTSVPAQKDTAQVAPRYETPFEHLPNPTENDLKDPIFNAIFQAIKTWDVNVPNSYVGYCGLNGSHVKIIMNAINSVPASKPKWTMPKCEDMELERMINSASTDLYIRVPVSSRSHYYCSLQVYEAIRKKVLSMNEETS